MIDRRRLGLRRPTPELLGLSTLDTVTCALAGAIVLMMFMAFLTKSATQVVLTDMRKIWETGVNKGEGTDNQAEAEAVAAAAVEVRNVAVLFIDLVSDVSISADVTQNCNFGNPLHVLKSAMGHKSGTDRSHALVIWAEQPDPKCTDFRIGVGYSVNAVPTIAPACTVTLVSGAHYDTRQYSSCKPEFDFYTAKDQVFRLERLQP